MTNTAAIIGLGNEVLGDDRVGLEVAEFLRQSQPPEASIDILTDTRGGLALAERMAPYHTVILLDAIRTRGGIPGEVRVFSAADFPVTRRLGAMHDVDVPTALHLLNKMGVSTPQTVWVVAIEADETECFSERLSPRVQAAVIVAAQQALRLATPTPPSELA
jgi:hydrogenase maturation protease